MMSPVYHVLAKKTALFKFYCHNFLRNYTSFHFIKNQLLFILFLMNCSFFKVDATVRTDLYICISHICIVIIHMYYYYFFFPVNEHYFWTCIPGNCCFLETILIGLPI